MFFIKFFLIKTKKYSKKHLKKCIANVLYGEKKQKENSTAENI